LWLDKLALFILISAIFFAFLALKHFQKAKWKFKLFTILIFVKKMSLACLNAGYIFEIFAPFPL
jgi:hypothetical protein